MESSGIKTQNKRNRQRAHYRKLLTFMMMFICTTLISNISHAKAKQEKYHDKYAALIMDADTGLILHQENANKRLHPASLTKLMTLLMVFDAIDHGALRLNDRVYISKHAASMIPSKLGLEPGSSIKVKDAIYALVTKSANDVAVALGEKLGGSESKFALMMTRKARTLGMTRTRFRNASGLHDPSQVSTARDMSRLAQAMLTRYKRHYHYFSKRTFSYQGKTYKSHNKLMDTYAGMDGMKTGYIKASGFNLVSSAVRHDRRLIGVVFGGKTGKSRNAIMERLMDRGFAKVGNIAIAKNKIPVPSRKPAQGIEFAALKKIKPAQTQSTLPKETKPLTLASRWDMLDSSREDSMFNKMIGQGDYDITVRNRIETGLIAISAHLGETIPSNNAMPQAQMTKLAALHAKRDQGQWAIQIGAFTTRERADRALTEGLKQLPSSLQHGKTTVAPTKTGQGWIFRSRLHGYSKQAAHEACSFLKDCIPMSFHMASK